MSTPELVTVTIDDRELQVPAGMGIVAPIDQHALTPVAVIPA